MFSSLSFRKKIILSQVISFIIFFALLFPFIEKMASLLVRDSLIESTTELKARLQTDGTENELIESLKKQEFFAFFRMSIINDQGLVIYDTHLGRLTGDEFQPYYHEAHDEVEVARKKGVGYEIDRSDTFGTDFAYVAETFPFQGKTYVLRTAFPYEEILDLTRHFKLGLLIFSFLVLLFFNGLIWLIFNRLTRPIYAIIDAITPYQKGDLEDLPEIILPKTIGPKDDFQRLASAFNSLSTRIQKQIDDLRSERNEKEAILESLGEGVVAVDEKLEVLYINFTACKMLGVSRKSLIYKLFQGTEEKSNLLLFQKCLSLLIQCQAEKKILTDSLVLGTDRKTYIDLVAVPRGLAAGAIIVIQDKTSHYRVIEMGKDFVANASHELRTPITIIKGYAEALHEMPDLTHTQIVEITEKIGRNCLRMENLVNSLLTLADIDNLAEYRFQECDLIALLENCRHIVRSIYSDAQVEIQKKSSPIFISADPNLLELAFNNLLENAAKYSPPPAKILIGIKVLEEKVVIEISDQGSGIPEEDLPYIFERFYRVDKTHSRRLGGAGLGLSIVKTIIIRHNGAIEAESQLDKGTKFTITLPLQH